MGISYNPHPNSAHFHRHPVPPCPQEPAPNTPLQEASKNYAAKGKGPETATTT